MKEKTSIRYFNKNQLDRGGMANHLLGLFVQSI